MLEGRRNGALIQRCKSIPTDRTSTMYNLKTATMSFYRSIRERQRHVFKYLAYLQHNFQRHKTDHFQIYTRDHIVTLELANRNPIRRKISLDQWRAGRGEREATAPPLPPPREKNQGGAKLCSKRAPQSIFSQISPISCVRQIGWLICTLVKDFGSIPDFRAWF